MKRIIISALLPILLLIITGNYTSAQVKDNVVKINIFGPIVGQYQLAYERAFNEHLTAQLSAGIINRNVDITVSSGGASNTTTFSSSGFIVIPELRYYFSESPKDFYAAAFFRYRTATTEAIPYTDSNNQNASTDYTRSAIGGGILVGYQILISDAVAIDIQIGPQYKAVSNTYSDDDPNISFDVSGENDGIGVRFAFLMGYAF